MGRRALLSVLLLAAICFPLMSSPSAISQANESTATTTIQKPLSGKCSTVSEAFTASKGEDVGGTFGADVPIDLYIISSTDFNAFIQSNSNCALPATAVPLFSEQNVIGTQNSYATTPIPADGTYYYLFIYHNSGVGQLSSDYATVHFTYPSFINFVTPQGSTNTMITTLPVSSATLASTSSTSTYVNSISTTTTSTLVSSNLFSNTNVVISNLCIGGNCNIANSSYTAPLQNGAASADVTFNVSYSNLPPGSTLYYGVYQATNVVLKALYVPGLGSSTPDVCTPLGENNTVAVCATDPISGTGASESVSFVLNFNSTETTYTLQAWAWAAHGAGIFSQISRSAPFEIIVKAPPTTPGVISIFGFQIQLTSLLQAVGGISLSGGGLIVGIYHKNRKRRTLSSYLTKIDSTYNQYAVNREDCKTQLEQLKREIIQLLNKGKIDESHFELLDEKIKDYLLALAEETQKITREAFKPSTAPPRNQMVNRKYCAECGTQLSLEDKTCHSCGSAQD